MKILVIGGGTGPEKDVSLRSAQSVREGLEQLGHVTHFVDQADGDEAVQAAAGSCDLIFPILHGVGGEDGVIQRVLDATGKPYLGSDVAASELCFDKPRVRQLLSANGIAPAPGEVVHSESFEKSPLTKAPFVLKPTADGSSIGTMIARTLPYDQRRATALLDEYGEMLLEKLIVGREITVPVLGMQALPVIEIMPPEGKEFDYDNKYNGASRELCPPQNVSVELQREAQELAERIHRLTGARHLSRTDMMIDEEGQIYVLEINTMPGMTSQSLYPKAAAVAGLSWADLMSEFVRLTQAT